MLTKVAIVPISSDSRMRWPNILNELTPPLPGTPLYGPILPYMGYIGVCRPKGYGFSAVLFITRVSISVGQDIDFAL